MEFIKPSEQFDLKGFYLEITSKCNLRCLHCYNESGILKNEISFELFKRLIDEFDEKPDITFSGGEPLLHPDIWKMLEYAQDKINNDSVLITNATLITDEIAKKLTASGIGVQVSLNGINAEQHDAICGKGNYEKTLRGLDRLLEAGNKKIIVRGMISKLNYKDAENFVLHWGQNAGHVVVSFLSAMGRGKSIKDLIDLDLFKKQEILNELHNSEKVNALKESGISVGIPEAAFSFSCPFITTSKEEKPPFAPRIDAKGNTYLCQIFDGIEYSLGNVNRQSLHEILASEKFEKFINHFYLCNDFKPACKKCVFKKNCGKGCIANSANNGSALETDGDCELRKFLMADSLVTSIAKDNWSYVKKKYKLNTTNFLFLCNCCQPRVRQDGQVPQEHRDPGLHVRELRCRHLPPVRNEHGPAGRVSPVEHPQRGRWHALPAASVAQCGR